MLWASGASGRAARCPGNRPRGRARGRTRPAHVSVMHFLDQGRTPFLKFQFLKTIAPIGTQVFNNLWGIVHTQITVDTLAIGPQLPPQTQTLYIVQVPSEGNQRHRGQRVQRGIRVSDHPAGRSVPSSCLGLLLLTLVAPWA